VVIISASRPEEIYDVQGDKIPSHLTKGWTMVIPTSIPLYSHSHKNCNMCYIITHILYVL
jgi:hypothetical protein